MCVCANTQTGDKGKTWLQAQQHVMLGFTMLVYYLQNLKRVLYEVLVVTEEVLRIVQDVLGVNGKVLKVLQF